MNKINELKIKTESDLEFITINKNGLNIISMNIRSIQKNIDKFFVLLESMFVSFSIIILTETWNIENVELYNLKDYKWYYNNSRINRNYGVIMYVKDEISAYIDHKKLTEVTVSKINFSLKIFPITYYLLSTDHLNLMSSVV